MDYILFICFIVSFFVTFLVTPMWIRKAKKINLLGIDMHKLNKPKIAELGGICVVTGFLSGLLVYIAFQTFYYHNNERSLQIMAILSTILIITIVGLMDDILGWKKGLKQWQKPFLTLFAVLPMVVLNVGHSEMTLPFIGHIDLGILYPLLLVPIGVVGAANGFNMLAGYNGLETGMGIIILSALGFVGWRTGSSWTAIIAFCMVFSLLAFLKYNRYPAKIFPGDTMTYSVGVLIACMAILGDMERVALILFSPYFIQFFLKARGHFKKESFAKVLKDGSLDRPYKKIYGLEHVMIVFLKSIKKKVNENNVVYSLFFLELILASFIIFSYI